MNHDPSRTDDGVVVDNMTSPIQGHYEGARP